MSAEKVRLKVQMVLENVATYVRNTVAQTFQNMKKCIEKASSKKNCSSFNLILRIFTKKHFLWDALGSGYNYVSDQITF